MKVAAEFSGSANIHYFAASCSTGVLILKLNAISLVLKRNLVWKCYCASLRFYFLDDGYAEEDQILSHSQREDNSVVADLISLVVRLSASLDLSTVFLPFSVHY